MITKTHLYQEIHEQPTVLATLLSAERESSEQLAAAMRARDIDHVIIAARGTSDNAARYAKYLWGARNRLTVGLATPSLFSIYKQPPRFGNALVLGISQSGKSPDIVSVLAEAQRQGVLTAAITNFPQSDLAQNADYVINLNTGPEQSVAATKTYTAELAAIALLSASLCRQADMFEELERVPDLLTEALVQGSEMDAIAERYCFMNACVTIGRGYNYATAFELALKLKELTYTMVEPYSSADFLHGPLALVEPRFPVITLAPSGIMLAEMLRFLAALKDLGAELIVISDDEDALAIARTPLPLPTGIPGWLSPLIAIVPGQLFAMHLAHVRDYDVDRPRSLRKVTETR